MKAVFSDKNTGKIKNTVICITVIGLLLSSYRFGLEVGKKACGILLYDTQGMLAYNHYSDYKNLVKLLEKNCINQVKSLLEYNKMSELSLLASFAYLENMENLVQYVELRSPGLIKSLEKLPPLNSKITLEECSQ